MRYEPCIGGSRARPTREGDRSHGWHLGPVCSEQQPLQFSEKRNNHQLKPGKIIISLHFLVKLNLKNIEMMITQLALGDKIISYLSPINLDTLLKILWCHLYETYTYNIFCAYEANK